MYLDEEGKQKDRKLRLKNVSSKLKSDGFCNVTALHISIGK